jgi:uncharacterized repeat protein (TIGR02543 family)
LTLYAKWTDTKYNITYKLYYQPTPGQTQSNPNPAKYTAYKPFALQDPVWAGAEFLGWYTENPYGVGGSDNRNPDKRIYILPEDTPGNITLYAYFEFIDYDIDYVLNGEDDPTFDPADSYNVSDAAIDLTAAPNIPDTTVVRPDHTFGGWYYDGGFTNEVTSLPDLTHGLGDVTLYAKWDSVQVPVYFNSHGGSFVGLTMVPRNDPLTEPTPPPTRGGYDFDAWYTSADFDTEYVFAGSSVTHAMVLHAGWDQQASPITVTYDSQGGTAMGQELATSGELLEPPSDPKRLGYIFTGWYKEAACTNEWDFASDTVSADITLYAGWDVVPTIVVPTIKVSKVTITNGTSKYTYKAAEKTHTMQHAVNILPANAAVKKVTWKSSNNQIATVNASGLVTFKGKEGTVRITATSPDGPAHYKDIKVVKNVTKLRTSLTTRNLTVNKKISVAPVIDDGSKVITAGLTYKSSNPKIATVDAKGNVKGIKAGKATITIQSQNGKKATVKINVAKKAVALKKFTLTGIKKNALTLQKGKTKDLKIKLTQSKASDLKITFKSSKSSVAKVDAAGRITAVKKGTATITTKVGSKTVKVKVTVK